MSIQFRAKSLKCIEIIEVLLSNHLTLHQDMWMTKLILKIFILNKMVSQIYPTELQLNKANSFETEAPFLDMDLSITNKLISSNNYDKRDDLNFKIVNFPFLDEDVPRPFLLYINFLKHFLNSITDNLK